MTADHSQRDVPILDRDVFDGLRAFGSGGVDVTERYVRLFLAEAETLLATAQRACAASDCAAVERAAHTLRGAAGFIGACRLAEAAGALEDAALERATASLGNCLSGLEAAYREAAAVLRAAVPTA
jgi:HPt (histidine-containing phosphotransfer) domain-containing protein